MGKKITENKSTISGQKHVKSPEELQRQFLDAEMKKENKAISHIGTKWKQRQNVYLALENHDINFSWDEQEVKEITRFCNEGGESIEILQNRYKRSSLDIRILLFDLALAEEIEKIPQDF